MPLHSVASGSESHAMKSFSLAFEPPCSGHKELNKAAIMAENSNPGIPIPICWEWYSAILIGLESRAAREKGLVLFRFRVVAIE